MYINPVSPNYIVGLESTGFNYQLVGSTSRVHSAQVGQKVSIIVRSQKLDSVISFSGDGNRDFWKQIEDTMLEVK